MKDIAGSRGFTLLELSIVMVIIGLIVGGIFFGRNLIVAAAVRSDIAALQQYDAAAAEFDNKYKCMPGDCATASTFFSMTGIGDNINNGDGNGMIDANSQYFYVYNPEPELFFLHLYKAGLSSFSPTGFEPVDDIPGKGFPAARTQGGYIPYTANYAQDLIAFSGTTLPVVSDGNNYWRLGMGGTAGGGDEWVYRFDIYQGGGLTPAQAYAFDGKIDDGFPLTGAVRAMCSNWAHGSFSYGGIEYGAVAGEACHTPGKICVSSASGSPYNFSEEERACGLSIKAGF